jgi:cytochrome c551/c552
MFKGHLTEEEMEDEHPAELARIRAGKIDPAPAREVVAKRRRVYLPVFAVLAAVMLAGIWFFIGYETTAVTTLPPAEDVTVFVHLTPTPLPTALPTSTPAPTSLPTVAAPAGEQEPAVESSWETDISPLMAKSCVACHSSSNKMGGLDLSSYQAALAGGASGAAIVPGEVQTSLLISRQASGQHPGQLSAGDLELVRHWIEIGAPEKAAATPAAGGGSTWEGAIATLMQAKCVQCHSDKVTLGDLDLSSYQTALKGGKGGVGIAPGDPDGSLVVAIQKAGGHAGQLTPEELELLAAWIKAGALEK